MTILHERKLTKNSAATLGIPHQQILIQFSLVVVVTCCESNTWLRRFQILHDE